MCQRESSRRLRGSAGGRGGKCAFGPRVKEPARVPAQGLRPTPVGGHLATATRGVEPVAPQPSALRSPGPAPAGALASPVEEGGTQACAPSSLLPPLSLSKSLKAPAPFVTPGAPNHRVSISLTPLIPLKTHLKTLQPGVCSGLYPH